MSSPRRAPGRTAGPAGRRRPVNLTIDPPLREAAEQLAERVGVPLARLVDVALREELRRHGVEVDQVAAVDRALEDVVRAARTIVPSDP